MKGIILLTLVLLPISSFGITEVDKLILCEYTELTSIERTKKETIGQEMGGGAGGGVG